MVFIGVFIIEIWKDIIGYETLYQVSNIGRVRSLDRVIIKSNGVAQFFKGKIIKPIENTDGYFQVKLCKNGSSHTIRVHQIVAQHFLDKPMCKNNNVYEVNHKDFNRKNNNVNNLEWVTHTENINYSAKSNNYKKRNYYGKNNPNYGNHKLSAFYKNNPEIAKEKTSRPKQLNGRAVKIELYDSNMNYIKTFEWIGGCANYLIENGYTKTTIKNIRTNINKAIIDNKLYLKHYYKKIA